MTVLFAILLALCYASEPVREDTDTVAVDPCAEIREKAKDDPCTTFNPENGCDIHIDADCVVDRRCEARVAALNDPCVHYSHFDGEKKACVITRYKLCNSNDSFWSLVKTFIQKAVFWL